MFTLYYTLCVSKYQRKEYSNRPSHEWFLRPLVSSTNECDVAQLSFLTATCIISSGSSSRGGYKRTSQITRRQLDRKWQSNSAHRWPITPVERRRIWVRRGPVADTRNSDCCSWIIRDNGTGNPAADRIRRKNAIWTHSRRRPPTGPLLLNMRASIFDC